jgi:hypothetical protein
LCAINTSRLRHFNSHEGVPCVVGNFTFRRSSLIVRVLLEFHTSGATWHRVSLLFQLGLEGCSTGSLNSPSQFVPTIPSGLSWLINPNYLQLESRPSTLNPVFIGSFPFFSPIHLWLFQITILRSVLSQHSSIHPVSGRLSNTCPSLFWHIRVVHLGPLPVNQRKTTYKWAHNGLYPFP